MVLDRHVHFSFSKTKVIKGIHVEKHPIAAQISMFTTTTPRILHVFAPSKMHLPATVSIRDMKPKKKGSRAKISSSTS